MGQNSSVPWCRVWHMIIHFIMQNSTQMAQKSSVPWWYVKHTSFSCYFGSNTSSCILLHHIASSCIALHRLASSCNVLHYLASSCIVLQRLAASSCTMWQTFKFGHKFKSCHNTFFGWTQHPCRVPSLALSCVCAALLHAANSGWHRVCTPLAAARTRSWWTDISDKERLSHSMPCETAPRRSSSNLVCRCLVHLRHPTHWHHKTSIILQHRTMWQTFNEWHMLFHFCMDNPT